MKRILLIGMLSVIFAAYGQDDPYKGPAEQKAIKMAHDILKVYYPSGDLCFSDSIYDSDWFGLGKEVDKEIREELRLITWVKPPVLEKPVYSSTLSSIFGPDACECRKYVAEFTAPYKGVIRCEIVPSNDRKPYFGQKPIFLFKFKDNGEIYEIYKHIMHML